MLEILKIRIMNLRKLLKISNKFAERVKDDNDKLKKQLEKANKKIKSIELAKGFEKCSNGLLDKWEKIFTNCLLTVAKEKGKREAQKEFKSFKSEFQKVITLNSNLQEQIEAMSNNRIMGIPNHPEVKGSNNNLAQGILSSQPQNFGFQDQIKSPKTEEVYKENIDIYSEREPHKSQQLKRMENIDFSQYNPHVFIDREEDSNSENLISNPMLNEKSYSESSNNEIESIIISNNSSKIGKSSEDSQNQGNFHC